MTQPFKSPTCARCAKGRGLEVPGDIHTVWEGKCENCGADGPVSPARDWREPGAKLHPEEWD